MVRLFVGIIFGSAIICGGCKTFSWKDGPINASSERSASPKRHLDEKELREQVVSSAIDLLTIKGSNSGYGGADFGKIVEKQKLQLSWRADQGINALVSIAKKKRAFYENGNPRQGDVVVFNNQFDRNNNGKNDDLYTGLGIVVDTDNGRFEVVTRTGHAARRAHVWPSRAAFRVVEGEIVNSFVRVPNRADAPNTAYLAGQLYAGFMDIEKLISN